jgi:diguanylate cyclase (GGDEF)-like protein
MNILLVDDSPTIQQELSNYAKNAGHSITLAKDGETAVQIMEMQGADLVICDVEMPGLNGFETVSIIRDSLGEDWVPIIIISRREELADLLQGYDVGADDYLVKPVDERLFNAKIKVMERFIGTQQRLIEIKNTPKELQMFDALTQVYNPNHFIDRARLHWSILARQMLSASVLLIRIDYYKQYQQHYEHEASKACYQSVAKCITKTLNRSTDFVGRMLENDFIVLLPDTGKTGSEKVAERICLAVEALNIENKPSRVLGVVSVTIGIATTSQLKTFSLETCIDAASRTLEKTPIDDGNLYKLEKLGTLKVSGVDLSLARE